MSATLCCSGCNSTSVQYLLMMLHLQSLQLAPLCSFSLTLILCLMKLSHNTKFKTVLQTLFKLCTPTCWRKCNKHLTWLVRFVIWPWSLSTCRLKSSFSSFIRSLSLLSFLKSSSKIFTWIPIISKMMTLSEDSHSNLVFFLYITTLTCSFSTAIWVSSSCFFRLLAASAKLPWPGGCWEDEGECRFKASSKA